MKWRHRDTRHLTFLMEWRHMTCVPFDGVETHAKCFVWWNGDKWHVFCVMEWRNMTCFMIDGVETFDMCSVWLNGDTWLNFVLKFLLKVKFVICFWFLLDQNKNAKIKFGLLKPYSFLSSTNKVSTGTTCQFLCVCLIVCLFVRLSGLFFKASNWIIYWLLTVVLATYLSD